jgi:prepilin-type N-terminal cleavage/methylation domain-containing protein
MNAQRRLSSRKPSVQTHAVDRHTRSVGFTLVELLVVITIIGILAAVAVPAIFSAVSTARSTAMKMELNSLETAVQKYQRKYGDYPPDFSDWAVVERHYRKIFPRISGDLVLLQRMLDANPYNPLMGNFDLEPHVHDPIMMDRGEVLNWVLGGYSSDPLRPFTGPGGPLELIGQTGTAGDLNVYQINTSRENALYDFVPGQLDLVLPTENSPVTINNYYVSGDNDLFLSYASSTKTKTPHVYFDSRTYDHKSVLGFNGFSRSNDTGSVRPYLSDIVQTNGGWQFMKPNSFQIIAPGIDTNFGWLSQRGGPNIPTDQDTAVYFQYPTGRAVTFDVSTNPITRALRTDVSRYQEPVAANKIDNFQQDNLTNFADGKLIDELQE